MNQRNTAASVRARLLTRLDVVIAAFEEVLLVAWPVAGCKHRRVRAT